MIKLNSAAGQWMDITQPLHASIGHWPGDIPFSYEISYSKEQTGSVNIGRITTSLHTGTHVDAPFHFDNDGAGIHQLDIERFLGLAKLIDITGFPVISREVLSGFNLEGVSRLLLKTTLTNNPHQFPETIPYFSKDGVEYIAEKEIKLIGVDVPSVDPLDSKEMVAHHTFHENDIYILENLMIESVPPGFYELIALPLKIEGADGSPVRAIIRPITRVEGENQ